MKKFDVYDWTRKQILKEAGEQEIAGQQGQQQQQTAPTQQPQMPKQTANDAFRSLQGKVISGVSFKPNGSDGGEINILTKNSYNPFKISWVNQNITITDLNGNIINIGDQ